MKKKIGLIVGYNGDGYHGLQYNKELDTIEKEVIKILLSNGCITELNSLDPQKIDLKSSSRTDKGVHASFNVINVKIIKEPTPELFQKLKSDFNDIGMILYKIVSLPKSFISYKQARSRIYKYTVPTFFLQESNFKDEYINLKLKDEIIQNNGSKLKSNDDLNKPENVGESDQCDLISDIAEKKQIIFREYNETDILPIQGYKIDSIEIFRNMMQMYVGTHNFHNFTVKKAQGDVKRYMMSIAVSEPFDNNGIEYVEVKIHGQSFLLHQIRKMISFAVLNCRYSRINFKENFDKVFSIEEVHVPKCPSEYLFLNHVFFDDFNIRKKQSGDEQIEIDEREKEQFEKVRIYPSILTKTNLYEWFKYLDAVRFHHDKFNLFLKE